MPTFQKFYSDTLGSRFIKSLLAQVPIPIFDSVVDGDHLVEGCYYVYHHYIIKCYRSGILNVSETEQGKLCPSDTLYPSIFLIVNAGYTQALFKVVSHIHDENIKTHSVYRSSTNYYDPETHYQLGRYIRYLYTTTGLNLFPYYNSYNFTQFSDVKLTLDKYFTVGISRGFNKDTKVIAVPILFGHTYSIAIDCPSQVLMRACIHDNSGYIDEDKLPVALVDALTHSSQVYSRLQFNDPVSFRIETSDIESVMFQHDLYLVIQLPSYNDSSIVVQENYVLKPNIICEKINEELDAVRIPPSIINPSLLTMNTHKTYAFSNRLLEYLLEHVITDQETIANNIDIVQTYLSSCYPEYFASLIHRNHKRGFWDKDISRLVLDLVEQSLGEVNLYDQDGFINHDALILLQSKGAK